MQTRTLISASDLTAFQKDLQKHRNANKTVLTICAGTGCLACGCEKVTETFRQELKKNKLEDAVEIKTTGCHGFCERGPLVVIQPQGLFYQKVTSTTAHDIIEQTIKNGQIVKKLLYHDPITKEIIQRFVYLYININGNMNGLYFHGCHLHFVLRTTITN